MKPKKAEKWLRDAVHDLFMDLCFYDRKNDEHMNVEKLRNLMDEGIISKEMMIRVFTEQIDQEYPDEISNENES